MAILSFDVALAYVDTGFCRVVYKRKGGKDPLFCYQLDTPGEFECFTVTPDGEPDTPIKGKGLTLIHEIPLPDTDTTIGKEFVDWVNKHLAKLHKKSRD